MEEFQVVRIIDNSTIVINAGRNNGVILGTEFKIYEDGDEIRVPGKKTIIGKLEKVKDYVIAYEIMDKMCLCKKKNYFDENEFNGELLNVDENDIQGGLISDNPIKLGDKAKCMTELAYG